MAGADSADAESSGCARPFEVSPGVWVRCQSRVRSKCPPCAELYRGDWAAIARSGVFDDERVKHYRFYLLTLTAPSFGRVHRVPKDGQRVKACRCGVTHSAEDAPLRGTPLDASTYDYAGLVAWNRDAGVLWDNTRRRLRDRWASVEFFIVREWQARGTLHVHVLVRIARAEAPAPAVLGDAARSAEAASKVDCSIVGWGEQSDCKAFRADGAGAKTIWYLSKALNYVLKDTTSGGAPGAWSHVARLAAAARSMRCSPGCVPSDCGSRVHERFGARSHVVSASRRTSKRLGWSFIGLTRKLQRVLRSEWARARDAAASGASAPERVMSALEGLVARAVVVLGARVAAVP